MSNKIILKAESLDGYLTEKDQEFLNRMDKLYEKAQASFKVLANGGFSSELANEEKKVIEVSYLSLNLYIGFSLLLLN